MSEQRVTIAEFVADFEKVAERAVLEPVILASQGCDRWVLLSAKEYARLRRRDRRVYRAHEVPEEILKAIEAVEPAAESEALDG